MPAALVPQAPTLPDPTTRGGETPDTLPPRPRPLIICVPDERLARALAAGRITAWTVGSDDVIDVIVIAAADVGNPDLRTLTVLASYAADPATDLSRIPNIKLGFYQEEPPQ